MGLLYATWAVLNIGLAVGLLVIFYRNFRQFSERFGCLPSALLFVAATSRCRTSQPNDPKQRVQSTFQRSVLLPLPRPDYPINRYVSLLESPTFHLGQEIHMHRKNLTDSTEVISVVMAHGFTAGLHWSPMFTWAELQPGYRLHYVTQGVLEWRLLNLPVYDQPLRFEGEMMADRPAIISPPPPTR